MDPYDRVLRRHGLAAHEAAVARGALGLREARVLGAQALEQLLDGLGQARVRGRLRRPGRVAARGRHRQQRQQRDAGRLVLVRHVRVVARGGQPVVALARAVLVVGAQVDVVELQVALDVGADGLQTPVSV